MQKLYITSEKLQAADTELFVVARLCNPLKECVHIIREDFDICENAALVNSNVTNYKDAVERRGGNVPPDKHG